MILYLSDNLLKIHRLLNLKDHQYCPAREDGTANITASIENIRALTNAKIGYILEIGVGETPPQSLHHLKLTPHPDAAALGLRWMVPPYWKPETAVYDIEYKVGDEYKYKNKLSVKALAKAVEDGVKITRVFSENGLTPEFLSAFKMRIVTMDKFRYAAPEPRKDIKKKKVK